MWKWGVPAFSLIALLALQLSGKNIALFQWLNHSLAYGGDTWWSYLTLCGDTTLALAIILLLLGRRPDLVWQFVLAAIFAALWAHGGKEFFSSYRPPTVLLTGTFHVIGPVLEHNSFPSGHTTTAFVLAGLICLQQVSDRLKTFVLAFAFLVGLSRIACGVHWPIDVLGGMFGGWLSAMLGIALAQRWRVGLNIWFQRVVAVLITGVAFWSMFYYDSGFANTWLLQFSLTATCLILSLKWQYRLFKLR
jgi:membrane-associated phospholipid phosphatase